MPDRKKFYITTPIFYPNGKPHMGHAYVITLGDVLARFHRLLQEDTYFLTGTDENTEKVIQAASKVNKDPKEFVDEIVSDFQSFYKKLGASHDQFIRTSDKDTHWPGVIEIWNRLLEAGDIYKGFYEGLYCVGCESFKTEKDLDENGNCPDHGVPPQKLKEENYFFNLSKYTKPIKEMIEKRKIKIIPESRRNEIMSLLNEGLEDVSFSRPRKIIPWGIPVPNDQEQVIYVWCDALTNYISALGFGREDNEKFRRFWPADVHLIGKDILRFHAAIWPGMLLSAKIELPKAILVHSMILSEGKKMSKTLGNVLDPQYFIKEFGADSLRYYLIREISPFEDSDMTMVKFHEAYTGNLVNGLGNLVSRIMKMAQDNLEKAPEIPKNTIPEEFKIALEEFRFNDAADFVWREIGALDGYIQETEPYKLVKEDKEKAIKIIEELVLRLYTVGRMLAPIMPETSERIKKAVKENRKPESLFVRK